MQTNVATYIIDDDKYSAHSGLINKTILTNPTLQTIDKALSNPKSVIDDLASFNGQNCFKYEGSCVNLNDNSAMANACGSGYTVVGWDDAGCGKKNCVRSLSPSDLYIYSQSDMMVSTVESQCAVQQVARPKTACGGVITPVMPA